MPSSHADEFTWIFTVGASESIHFLAEPAGEGGLDLPEGQTPIYATVYFTYVSGV